MVLVTTHGKQHRINSTHNLRDLEETQGNLAMRRSPTDNAAVRGVPNSV